MKIRIEWKQDRGGVRVVDGRIEREYVTLDAKDIRRLCGDVMVQGEPYLVEVCHSDPMVPPNQSPKRRRRVRPRQEPAPPDVGMRHG